MSELHGDKALPCGSYVLFLTRTKLGLRLPLPQYANSLHHSPPTHRASTTVTELSPLGRAAIRNVGCEGAMRLAVLHELTGRGALSVVVQKLGRSEFSWMLMRKQSSIALAGCVAASSKHFPDYDQALDAGFEALKAFSTVQIEALST